MKSLVLCNYRSLSKLLKNSPALAYEQKTALRYLIDNNEDCWRIWNKVRWDAAMNSQGVQEIKKFFGEDFVPYHDSSWALSREWNAKKRNTKKSIENFYRSTSNYIYNSVIFYESGDRINLEKYFEDIVDKYDIKSVTDFGCGVGNDGLMMISKGIKVNFVDFDSPTLRFLKWRLDERKVPKRLYSISDLTSHKKPKKHCDMFWSIDVIEHMQNSLEIFSHISKKTKVIAYYTDNDDKAGGRHPFHFKIREAELAKEFLSRGFHQKKHDYLRLWVKNH